MDEADQDDPLAGVTGVHGPVLEADWEPEAVGPVVTGCFFASTCRPDP